MQATALSQTPDRSPVETSARAIKVQYRDENYGSVYGAVAFRFGSTVALSDDDVEELHAVAEAMGFSFNFQRSAWIREFVYEDAPDVKQALEDALRTAGFHLPTN